jgi:hypothetical protein
MSERRRSRRVGIVIAVLIGAVLVLNLLASGLDRAVGGREPKGVPGSAYATTANGLAAYATLLTRYGHGVSEQRGSLADHPPDPSATFVVIEPSELTEADTGTLLQFVTLGGRLVIGGRAPFYLHNLRDQPPTWSSSGRAQWPARDPLLPGVGVIETAAEGSWIDAGSGTPVVGSFARSLLTREAIGLHGSIYFLADPSPLENAYLARADNAAFGLAIAGNRPVVFAEGVHGFGITRGISAIPTVWKVALVLVGLAAIAFVWSRARRFGPPDKRARDLPPARAEYVRSLALTMERTHDRSGALAPVQAYARNRIARRTGLGPDPTPEQIAQSARDLRCTDDEIAALVGPIGDDRQALALGRASARVAGDDRRME